MHSFVIDRDKLLEPLSQVIGVTEKKSLMPYLSNVLIRFAQKSEMFATDLEISAISTIDYEKEGEPISLVVGAKKLHDVLKELDKGEIVLEIQHSTINLKQENTEFVLTLYDPDEFPEPRKIEAEVSFSMAGNDLLETLSSVSFAIGTDESRYVLTGVYMKGTTGLTMVATDGYRMALTRKYSVKCPDFPGVIVPAKTVRELQRIISGEDDVVIKMDRSGISFETDRVKLTSRIIEGQYPDYEAAIPKYNRFVLKVDRWAFYKGLKKVAAIMSKNEPVVIKAGEGFLEVRSESEIGRAKETIGAEYSGSPKEMNFNMRFLLDAISHCKGEYLTMRLPEDYGAIVIEDSATKEYINVIMPIKV
ncbi:MAG: DNA polymerase III subunit beta [Deltaproteobacteria bacterium]|nr:DNA polymerase III subunit beta [Deltaproteobacteria bacterium]